MAAAHRQGRRYNSKRIPPGDTGGSVESQHSVVAHTNNSRQEMPDFKTPIQVKICCYSLKGHSNTEFSALHCLNLNAIKRTELVCR